MSIKKENKKIVEYIRKKKIFSDILNDQQNNWLAGALNGLCDKYTKKTLSKIIIENFCESIPDELDKTIIDRLELLKEDSSSQTYSKLIAKYGN